MQYLLFLEGKTSTCDNISFHDIYAVYNIDHEYYLKTETHKQIWYEWL